MTEPQFHRSARRFTADEIVALTGAKMAAGGSADHAIERIAALDEAGPGDLAFLDNAAYEDDLPTTRAGICLVKSRFLAKVPPSTTALVSEHPYRAFVKVAQALFPDALQPASLFGVEAVAPGAMVHPSARLEAGVKVDPGAVIGPGAEIGAGTVIAAGAVIGPDVRIGRDCAIGAGTTLVCALVGNRVIVHPGCRIGQDGFGYVMGAAGHSKVPQVGRVVIQDGVEIGANTTVDRGASRDTVIGEGTKIDNLVQVGHNVVVGRHCVIVAQSGLAGSSTLGDFVVLGARAGTNNHVTVGDGAQIAATSVATHDVPAGARWGGTPAKPIRLWFREMKALERLARGPGRHKEASTDSDDGN